MTIFDFDSGRKNEVFILVSLRIRIADVDINNDTMQKFDQFLGQASQGGSIIKGIIAAASNMEPF